MIDRLTAAPLLRNSQSVIISELLQKTIQDVLDITRRTGRELGIFACGNKLSHNEIILTRGLTKTSIRYDQSSFWFNPVELGSIERGMCGTNASLISLIHTHPDRNSVPSMQDRLTSLSHSLMGCVAGSQKMRCFYGDKDLSVLYE